jgi:hypothetical protein
MEQAIAVVNGIKECSQYLGTTVPVVFCGDFNAETHTPAYKWMSDHSFTPAGRGANIGDFEAKLVAAAANPTNSASAFQMKSSYLTAYGNEPECTFRTPTIAHCVDYIWYWSGSGHANTYAHLNPLSLSSGPHLYNNNDGSGIGGRHLTHATSFPECTRYTKTGVPLPTLDWGSDHIPIRIHYDYRFPTLPLTSLPSKS